MSNTIAAGHSYATQQASEQYVAPEYPEDREASQLRQGPSGHVYGYEAPEGGLPPFISDGELMTWLQTKSRETYGQVRDLMGLSTERSKLMQDLTHLKGEVEKDPKDADAIVAEMQALNEAYAGTPFEEEVSALCGPEAQGRFMAHWQSARATTTEFEYDDTVASDIQATVDRLGRDDQLALVNLQSLMSDLRETAQLASNILASRDQASNTVVNNIT